MRFTSKQLREHSRRAVERKAKRNTLGMFFAASLGAMLGVYLEGKFHFIARLSRDVGAEQIAKEVAE